MSEKYDFAIIGAGFFGIRLALILGGEGFRVVVIERESQICVRASYVNQARVHNGYHYPRSYSTALGSHKHYERFLQEMSGCIDEEFEHVYAIARYGSSTNAYQFKKFCQEIGLPLRPLRKEVKRLFDNDRIEEAFTVREAAFNMQAIRKKLNDALSQQNNIKVLLDTNCSKIELGDSHANIKTSRKDVEASGVFLVGYAGINNLLRKSSLNLLDLKGEITEICIVDVPKSLQRFGVTVMDGPFFSLMPMPAEKAHSFTHVRYTPHTSWDFKEFTKDPYKMLESYDKHERFLFMQKDAQRYIPVLKDVKYRYSLFEVKTVPNKNEVDDGRPIVFRQHSIQPPCISILGSKVDSIFELEDAVRHFLENWRH